MKKTLITLTALCSALLAHDMWIDDSALVHYGHRNIAHSHGDNKIIQGGEMQYVSCLKDAKIISFDSAKQQCDALFVQLKPTYYTKTPYGTKKLPKNEVKMAISSFLSLESIKRIYNYKGVEPFKKGLELTLINNLSEIEVGDKARLLVLFDAKPKEGVTVANDDKPIGISGKDGRVNVRIKQKGLQNLKASFSIPCDSEKCDKMIYSTTLNIEVRE